MPISKPLRLLLASVLPITALTTLTTTATPASSSTPVDSAFVPMGYSKIFSDEFDGTTLNTAVWKAKNEQGSVPQYQFTSQAAEVNSGSLELKVYSENGQQKSGWVTTEDAFEARYGYMEAKIDFDLAKDAGMAWWLFDPKVNEYGDPWNNGVEMDMIEIAKTDWQGNPANHHGLISHNWGTYGADWENHPALTSGWTGSTLDQGWHTYGVKWEPTKVTYYIDGVEKWSVSDTTATPVSRREQFLVFSTVAQALPPTDFGTLQTTGTKMKVDYVRVYQPATSTVGVPTNVQLSGGTLNPKLSWDLVGNATSYIIEQQLTSGSAFVPLVETSSLSYSLPAQSGATYRVAAKNALGQGQFTQPVTLPVNLALNKPVTASSERSPNLKAYATDSNPTSFWESNWANDNEHLTIDLGAPTSISGVRLDWEHAYAKQYKIQTSLDNITWSTPLTTNSNGGEDLHAFAATSARYVRMQGVQRAHTYADPSPFGYAIKTFEVYQTRQQTPTTLAAYRKNGAVKLKWTSVPQANAYNIYESTTPDGPFTKVQTYTGSYVPQQIGGQTVYVHMLLPEVTLTNKTNNTHYYYTITAVTAAGESGFSPQARVRVGADVAMWNPVTASSKADADTRPYKAVDGRRTPLGSLSTAWSSQFTDDQWLYVDLRDAYDISSVVVDWNATYGYGQEFKIQFSNDAQNWTTASHVTGGTGQNYTYTRPSGQTKYRYVRMQGVSRGHVYGYALDALEVYAY